MKKRFKGRAGLSQRSAMAKGLMAIMAGTAIGQLLAAVVAPLLSRMYSPADFGVFSIVSSMAVTLGTIAAFRYELAVPLPTEDEDARALVVAGALICLVFAVIATVIAWFLANWSARLFHDPRLASFIPLVPVIASAFGVFRLLNQWALRQQRYTATARRNVLQSLSTVFIQLLGGVIGIGAAGLVAGLGAGQAIGAVSLYAGSGLHGDRLGKKRLKRNLWRYRRFAYLLAPAGLINAAGIYVPLLMIAAYYGTTAAGYLGFTQRILALPMTLVGQAVAQVYLSELARVRRDTAASDTGLFWKASKRLGLLGAVGALILVATAPWLFSTIFGHQWDQSGAIAQALAISIALQFIASPLSQTLIVFERTTLQLCWDIGRLTTSALSVVVAHAAGADLLACIWAMSVTSAVAYLVSWDLSRRTVRDRSMSVVGRYRA